MFWIEKYRPRDFSDIVGQDQIQKTLSGFAEKKNLPHLLLCGPHGTGKSVSVEITLKSLYGQSWQENSTFFLTSDLFEEGKAYFERNERFVLTFKREDSFISNLKHAINWYASIRPLDAEFKVMVFEDAHALTRDAQQALRRIMERYSATCRFVFCATNSSSLISPILSRCLPLYLSPVSSDLIKKHLEYIREQEGVSSIISDENLILIVHASCGDLRKAIMTLQVLSETKGEFDLSSLSDTEQGLIALLAFRSMQNCDISAAQMRIESLMIDHGLTAREVLNEFRKVVRREYNHPKISDCIARTDYMLSNANNEYLQMNALVADVVKEVFL